MSVDDAAALAARPLELELDVRRRLIAIFEFEDFGRPRGLSITAAVRAPKILGKTSLAGRAFAIIAAVHSGFSRLVFLGLD